jgi:CheY-like chemotaxis protein
LNRPFGASPGAGRLRTSINEHFGAEGDSMKKVLIVDDEPDIVSYLEMILQDNGFETDTAGNGNEALEKVRKNRPDLVTLDISMPEASGTRFYKELRTNPESRSVLAAVRELLAA